MDAAGGKIGRTGDGLPGSVFRRPSNYKEDRQHSTSSSSLPSAARTRLQGLFREVEKEFEALYLENVTLREKLARLEKGDADDRDKNLDEPDAFEAVLKTFSKKHALKTRRKFKAHTSKIVSSFKAPLQTASVAREYRGHRDGLWDVAASSLGHPLIGTASADKTARIWGVDSGRCLLTYAGHAGSVNSISFHPAQDIALTASGDGHAHVWKALAYLDSAALSSEESGADSSEEDFLGRGLGNLSGVESGGHSNLVGARTSNIVRQPIVTLTGHQSVVIGCQWLDNEIAVTAGWDRSANLYNVTTGSLLQSLAGHDDELTHVACHPTKRLVTTSSVDTTFRLWDFRETIHSVSVFQGHTEAVTSTAFSSNSDQIVSGSDDHSVKVWDLRNMRAPVTIIQTPAAVNRLAVSQNGTIAIPQDNRHVSLYDLSGARLLPRLPRDSASKKSHHRMVSSVCWAPDTNVGTSTAAGESATGSASNFRTRANLFSAGFDRVAFGWWVRPVSKEDDKIAVTATFGGGGGKVAKDGTF